ncbi:MAG TPA: hypothetical protein ENJ82_14000 [Bacteroidetes bacterium]|nr:hypothetical protein [Bacteroidota bacterium]
MLFSSFLAKEWPLLPRRTRQGSGPYRVRAALSCGLATGVATFQAPQAHVSRVGRLYLGGVPPAWARDGRDHSFAVGASARER